MINLKFFLLLLTITFMTLFLHAQVMDDVKTNAFNITLGPQLSSNNLTWSIADASGTPNVLSELKFSNIKSGGVYAGAAYRPVKLLSLKAMYSAAGNYNGRVNDRDYHGNNRTDNYYDETFDSRRGNVQQFTGGVDFHIMENHLLRLRIGGGYLLNKQLYTMTRSDIPDLNSSYNTRWMGTYTDVGLSLQATDRFDLHFQLRFTSLYYRADANWNNIQDFQHPLSFRHSGKGYGINGGIECRYHFNSLLYLSGSAALQAMKIKNGRDRAYLHEKDEQGNYTDNIVTSDTRLNEVRTDGAVFRFGIGICL